MATYTTMASDHTCKDTEADPTRVALAQRVVSSTGKALVNILNVGTSHSRHNYERCFDNVGSAAEDAPSLQILPKVHKPMGPAGHPQSRPVVAASTGLTSRAGNIIADFLGPLVDLEHPRLEDLSTEEVISQLEEVETIIRNSGETSSMVGSLDVKAL